MEPRPEIGPPLASVRCRSRCCSHEQWDLDLAGPGLVDQSCSVRACRQCLGQCGEQVTAFTTVTTNDNTPLRQSSPDSIWGQTYVQLPGPEGGEGFASYHFVSPSNAYIGYHSAPPDWTLEDGSAVPAKAPFRHCSFDRKARAFTGVVVWLPTRFDGEALWSYNMVFSEDFRGITEGTVVSFREARQVEVDGEAAQCVNKAGTMCEPRWQGVPGTESGTTLFSGPRGLEYVRVLPPPTTIFGQDYIQERSVGHGVEGVASYHFPAAAAFSCATFPVRSDRRHPDPSAPELQACVRHFPAQFLPF